MALLLPASGCGRRDEPARPVLPQRGGTLRVAVLRDLVVPYWVAGVGASTARFYEHVVPPLVRIDANGRMRPYAAIDLYDSGFDIEFPLRRLRWSDGAPVTGRDYVLTAQLLADPRAASPQRVRTDLIASVSGDDSTLHVRFKTTYAQRLRDAFLWPSPAHVWQDSIDPATWAPRLACGPFQMVRASPRQLLLARHDGSGFAPALFDSVHVVVRAAAAAVRDFESGRIDVIDDLPATFVPRVRARGARVIALVGRSYLFIGWNLRDVRWRDVTVRRALAQAVDQEALLARFTLGQGAPARGPLLPVHAIADTHRVLPFDRNAAERALAAAGWVDSDRDGIRDRRGAKLAVQILAADTDSLRIAVATEVARALRRAGVGAEVRVVRIGELMPRLRSGDFEAFIGEWFPDPGGDIERVWRSTAGDRENYIGFADRGVDSLLDRAWADPPRGGREAALSALQARIYGLQPYLFLFQRPQFLVLDAAIQDAEPDVVSAFWNLPHWWRAPRAARRRGRLARGGAAVHLAPRRCGSRRHRRPACCS
jgi:peptide/nickel transport system substrate-binding protein